MLRNNCDRLNGYNGCDKKEPPPHESTVANFVAWHCDDMVAARHWEGAAVVPERLVELSSQRLYNNGFISHKKCSAEQ